MRLARGVLSQTISSGLKEGLLAFWELGESTGTRVDAHAAYDLTENGTVSSDTGVVGAAASFNGNNANFLSNTALKPTGAISVFGWVKKAAASGQAGLVARWDTNGNRSFALFVDSNAKLRFAASSDGAASTALTGATSIGTAFVFVGAIFNSSSSIEVFLNGVSDGILETGVPSALYAGNAPLRLGLYYSGNFPLNGLLDQVGIWDRVLTGDEITALYNAGNGLSYASL